MDIQVCFTGIQEIDDLFNLCNTIECIKHLILVGSRRRNEGAYIRVFNLNQMNDIWLNKLLIVRRLQSSNQFKHVHSNWKCARGRRREHLMIPMNSK